MPRLYEDDLRNKARDDISDTLAARQSPIGYGLEQAAKPFAAGVAVPQNQMAQGAALPVPQYSVPGVGDKPQLGGTLAPEKARLGAGGMLPPLPELRPANLKYMRRL